MQDFIFIILGLFLWILGAYWLLKGAAALSLKSSIPKTVIGMTVVSLATSVPELLVSAKAVTDGMPDVVLGAAIGSNMANLGLVLAIVLMLSGMVIHKSFHIVEWSVMMLASVLFFGFIYFDGEIQRYEGFFMLVALFLFLVYLLWSQRGPGVAITGDDIPLSLYRTALFLGLGGLALWGGSQVLVKRAMEYAAFYAPENIVGTALLIGIVPELAVALFAVVQKQKAIALGNLMGSNMFNLLGVLGISAMMRPLKVMDQGLMTNDILWMMGISFILLPLMFFSRGAQLNWKGGIVLLGTYFAFIYFATASRL